MALEGTIKDFGLADIFQLIGIQRKTGVLTLENDEDTVTVKVLEGQVVAADTRLRNLEDLLGSVLVRTGRITEAQLQEALMTQKNTLQRLGYILVHSGFISDGELSEALNIQVSQIVYRLFRWRDARYHFQPADDVEYDREHFVPVAAETILMEGARMIDEWPIIERKIRSEKTVFEKTDAGREIDKPVESLVDENVDFGFDGAEAAGDREKRPEIKLSNEEREILHMVGGRSTVQDIVDRSSFGEFDTYRALYELLTRNLIAEAAPSPAAVAGRQVERAGNVVGTLVLLLLLAASGLALATLNHNPLTPWRLNATEQTTDQLRAYASRVRLERIERAIRVFYLDTGNVPNRLELLSAAAYLDRSDLLDPWGRPYAYRLSAGGFSLAGRDGQGQPSDDLTLTRRFSPAQRMLLEGAANEASASPAP